MKCPSCSGSLHMAGRTWKCDHCDGAWVKSDVLVPLLEQSASALIELPWKPNQEDHARACPECAAVMQSVKLGDVALDRCEPHGVWFDAKELADLIHEAKHFKVDLEKVHETDRSLTRRLADFFHHQK